MADVSLNFFLASANTAEQQAKEDARELERKRKNIKKNNKEKFVQPIDAEMDRQRKLEEVMRDF